MSYFTIFLLFNNNMPKFHMDSPRIKSVFGSYQVRPGFFKENLHNITKWNSFLKKIVNLKLDVISYTYFHL